MGRLRGLRCPTSTVRPYPFRRPTESTRPCPGAAGPRPVTGWTRTPNGDETGSRTGSPTGTSRRRGATARRGLIGRTEAPLAEAIVGRDRVDRTSALHVASARVCGVRLRPVEGPGHLGERRSDRHATRQLRRHREPHDAHHPKNLNGRPMLALGREPNDSQTDYGEWSRPVRPGGIQESPAESSRSPRRDSGVRGGREEVCGHGRRSEARADARSESKSAKPFRHRTPSTGVSARPPKPRSSCRPETALSRRASCAYTKASRWPR